MASQSWSIQLGNKTMTKASNPANWEAHTNFQWFNGTILWFNIIPLYYSRDYSIISIIQYIIYTFGIFICNMKLLERLFNPFDCSRTSANWINHWIRSTYTISFISNLFTHLNDRFNATNALRRDRYLQVLNVVRIVIVVNWMHRFDYVIRKCLKTIHILTSRNN